MIWRELAPLVCGIVTAGAEIQRRPKSIKLASKQKCGHKQNELRKIDVVSGSTVATVGHSQPLSDRQRLRPSSDGEAPIE